MILAGVATHAAPPGAGRGFALRWKVGLGAFGRCFGNRLPIQKEGYKNTRLNLLTPKHICPSFFEVGLMA